MVTAAKTLSQMGTHMAIAFVVMYGLTGSATFGGAIALIEPACNVLLLPLHQRAWQRMRGASPSCTYTLLEKFSQTALHMGVAFAVMYLLSGSLLFGGLAALLEPVANVLLLPVHDRAWEALRRRLRPAHVIVMNA